MDRATVYTQEQARSVDFLFAQRATMIGLGKLAQAAFGSNTVVRGLAVTPNSPAALNVLVGIGEIYSMAQVDATPWGALAADTTDTIVKQGLNMAVQTISTPAPSTSGYSINYLIEAQYQDQDNVPVVLPYYNSANPSQPLNGQGGGGGAQATERQGVCVIQAKAGIAAATGTQTTPSVDSGWTALAVVTVANGQSTVTAGNISVPAGVPQLTSLLQMMQTGSTQYAIDTSTTANQITIALTPPITAYVDGQSFNFQAANTNTGPCNINAGPGNIALNGAAGAFQGGEIVAGKFYEAVYRANTGTAVVVCQSGGAQQINPATQSQHAMQLGQLGVKYKGVTAITGNTTMAVSAVNGIFPVQVTSTITLPLASSVPVGSTYTFFYYQSASVPTFVPSGSDVFSAGSGNISTYTPKSTGYIQFTAEVSGLWEVTGSATLDQASGFAAATNYFKQPNGKIIAWMYGSASAAGVSNTMPITFPNAIRTISVTCNAAKGGAVYSVAGNISSTSVVDATASGTCNVFIIAIGD